MSADQLFQIVCFFFLQLSTVAPVFSECVGESTSLQCALEIWNLPHPVPHPETVLHKRKSTCLLNYKKFCFCSPLTLPSQCPNSYVLFQHLQQASAIDLAIFEKDNVSMASFSSIRWNHLYSRVTGEGRKEKCINIVFIFLACHFFSFGCCPWCRWRLNGSASPWATYRSTAPQWSWSYSCFAQKLQLKVSSLVQCTYNI